MLKALEFTQCSRALPWRRKWQRTPIFLPGESHRQKSLGAIVHGVAESRTQLKWFSMHACKGAPRNSAMKTKKVQETVNLLWSLFQCQSPELLFRVNPEECDVHVSFLMYHAQLLSRVRLFTSPWTIARQAPLSMGFSRQEYLSGLLFPTSGDPADPRIKPVSLCLLHWQEDSLSTAPPGKL